MERGDHDVTLDYRIPFFALSLGTSLGAVLVYGWLLWARTRSHPNRLIRFLEATSGRESACV